MSLSTFLILLLAHLLDKLTSHKRPGLSELLYPILEPFQTHTEVASKGSPFQWAFLILLLLGFLALYPLLRLLPNWIYWPMELAALTFTLSSYQLIGRIRLLTEALDIARFDQSPKLARKLIAAMADRDSQRMNLVDMNRAAIEASWQQALSAWAAPVFWYLVGDISGLLIYGFARETSLTWHKQHPRNIRPKNQPLRFIWQLHRWMLYPADWILGLAFVFYGRNKSLKHVISSSWKWPGAGGVTLAAGAGGMGIQLGGPIHRKGRMLMRPLLGPSQSAQPGDLAKAMRWLRASWRLWMMVALVSVLLL